MGRIWIGCGSLAGLGAVAMSAYAAHGLTSLDTARLAMVQSAIQMQGWHALALVACGIWAARGGRLAVLAGAAFTLGMLLFCGDIYALVLADIHLAPAAPIGGTLLMLGWALLGASAIRNG